MLIRVCNVSNWSVWFQIVYIIIKNHLLENVIPNVYYIPFMSIQMAADGFRQVLHACKRCIKTYILIASIPLL